MDFGYVHGSQDIKTDTVLSLTASASADTKGSYSEWAASLTHDAEGFILSAYPNSTNIRCLMDIAIGAASSEKVILSNMILDGSYLAVYSGLDATIVPLKIPIGSRVSARIQAGTTGSVTAHMKMYTYSGGLLTPPGFSVCDTYGASTAVSGGTQIDPGASAGTKGAWVELSAACEEIEHLIVAVDNRENSARTTCIWLMDIAIGGAGSEKVVVPDLRLASHSGIDGINPVHIPIPICIPAGSRLAVRASCTITDATDRLLGVALYGFR